MNKFNMDSHMHFDLYKNRQDVLNYIEENKSYTIAVTNLPDLYKKYFEEKWNYKYVKLALGFHPELVSQYGGQIEIFKEYFSTTRFIGEVGLDYSLKSFESQKKQRVIFKQIIDLCKKDRNKIKSVHTRKAESDCLDILDGFTGKVILHWYSGNLENLKTGINRGYFFSINQQMIMNQKGRNIIDMIPINQIVIESDAPFTAGLNLSYSLSFIDDIVTYLSKSKKMSEELLYVQIKENFKNILMPKSI